MHWRQRSRARRREDGGWPAICFGADVGESGGNENGNGGRSCVAGDGSFRRIGRRSCHQNFRFDAIGDERSEGDCG